MFKHEGEKMSKIVLTGGGTAGHVTPNLALLPALNKEGFEITYVGSYDGIEKQLATDQGLNYVGVATGKFRRYLDVKNLTDPFKVVKGFNEAKKFLKDYKEDQAGRYIFKGRICKRPRCSRGGGS